MENMIEHVASYLKLNPLDVRAVNYYKKDDVTPTGEKLPYFNVDAIVNNLRVSCDFDNRRNQIDTFNRQNRWKKKGISLTPIKWGCPTTFGYYNCQVSIYAPDGSVTLTTSGAETGQGINTICAQVCAFQLGAPLELVSVKLTNDTFTNPNGERTGASFTTEACAQGISKCCEIINNNLVKVKANMKSGYTWQELISEAFRSKVDLSAHYYTTQPKDTLFLYDVHAAACSEAIVDVLTGETQILRTDILYDCGQCLNGTIDMGQAEGAFVMGIGFWFTEKVVNDPVSGLCLSNSTWTYHPPTSKDIPADFRVNFLKDNPNPVGFLGSKAVGEPPLCLSPCLAFAVKRAIEAARAEFNNTNYFALNSPATVEDIQQYCAVDYKQFKLN
jgi:xanthine dehydrogenase/oxidase